MGFLGGWALSYERGTSLTRRSPPPPSDHRGAIDSGLQFMHGPPFQRQFFIDNLLVRIHFIVVMIRWTGLAPWECEFFFSGSQASTFLDPFSPLLRSGPVLAPRCVLQEHSLVRDCTRNSL